MLAQDGQAIRLKMWEAAAAAAGLGKITATGTFEDDF